MNRLSPIALALILLLAGLNLYQYWRTPPPLELTPQQIIERFTQLEFLTLFKNAWFGANTLQSPTDVWTTQEILWAVKPDVIIETGTWQGGSAALWAMILMHITPDAKIVTIDIEDNVTDAIRALPIVQERVEFIIGSSTAPEVVADVRQRVEGKRVLVILDSDHSRDHVLNELNTYWDLVPVGSYIIVQDTAANGHPVLPDHGPGPWEAVEAFLKANDHFAIDTKTHRMLFTIHPRGYLKRVR
jgi:cephalosporin hydroxylase